MKIKAIHPRLNRVTIVDFYRDYDNNYDNRRIWAIVITDQGCIDRCLASSLEVVDEAYLPNGGSDENR